ncbi:MAG: deoxyribodipyrimidine photo-lyase [Rhodobacteraceae bacterium]|nr:deoxyribodipyrimidine photo-lyase [Paracoccaceae bacterium]
MQTTSPIIVWFRRDLRLSDHPALHAAARLGRPVIPVFVADALVDDLGAAPSLRLEMSLDALAKSLEAVGSRLVLRQGQAAEELDHLIAVTGAQSVYWTRAYDPGSVARDTAIKADLKARGIEARSFGGALMFEPWTVTTKAGTPHKVYTPFWKTVRDRAVDAPLPAPERLVPPEVWPASDRLSQWALSARMQRGAGVVRARVRAGEEAALRKLSAFVSGPIEQYKDLRDFPAENVTSALSDHLATGEISPHQCWHAGQRALADGAAGAEHFLKEVVWREFAYHLMHHTPHILTGNWRPEWDSFPWQVDDDSDEVRAWKQGRTGIEMIDAAMRELYVTGRMHNRGRMLVASYLTKHLMTHWQIGLRWFEDCLVDWDPASNAMGWQWAAGSGPDAAPYFRVFNPELQGQKFDPDKRYIRHWVAEGQGAPGADALAFFDAVPRSWALSPHDAYPAPIITSAAGRARALAAYQARKSAQNVA